MFWWVVTPILAFYLKMSTGVPIDRISHLSREFLSIKRLICYVNTSDS